MNLSDIKTELFTRTTITDFGVRVESFDRELWRDTSGKEYEKMFYMIGINILKCGDVFITTRSATKLSAQQLDEIQRISQILRMEK